MVAVLIPKICRVGAAVVGSMALTAFLGLIGVIFLFSYLVGLGGQ